jgi:hypothetical protein
MNNKTQSAHKGEQRQDGDKKRGAEDEREKIGGLHALLNVRGVGR